MAHPDVNFALDLILPWLEQIAKNTAETRDSVQGRGFGGGGGGSGGPGTSSAKEDARWEKFGRRIEQALGAQMMTRLAQAQGLANRGFGGTAESMYNQYAMDMLGRQFAAVMLPVLQAGTYLAEQIERRMRVMSGGEQNRMLGAGIGALAGYRIAGVRGALAGGVLGAGFMSEGGDANSGLMGAGAGALLGARFGPYGALGGAALGYISQRGDYGELRRRGSSEIMSGLGSTYAAAGDLADFVAPRGVPWLMRQVSGESSMGDLAREHMGIPTSTTAPLGAYLADRTRRALGGAGAADPRRDVTPYKFEVGEAGSSLWRIQEGVMRATGGGAGDPGPLKPVVDVLLMVYDKLQDILAIMGGPAPAPRPAGA